jgi:DNA processing protein
MDQVKVITKEDFKKFEFLKPLLNIYKCPEKLYYKGKIPNKNQNTKVVSIIGSRKMTPYGKDVILKIISELSGYDIIIISGLAMGCDSEAHRQALKNNLVTIAFPGSGIEEEVLYPQSNIKLAREILYQNGAIISEFEPKQKSALWTFPSRNRILAGVSDFILIIEAEEKSGTQITARLGLEYGKDIGIIPGSIFSIYSKGTAQLWKDGAYPITSGQDILDILNVKPTLDIFSDSISGVDTNLYTDTEKFILENLDAPIYKEQLIEKSLESGFAIDLILTSLINLESKGIIKDSFDEIKKIK